MSTFLIVGQDIAALASITRDICSCFDWCAGRSKRVDFVQDYEYLKNTVGFLFDGGGPKSVGRLTVCNEAGIFLRDDEHKARSRLPPRKASPKLP